MGLSSIADTFSCEPKIVERDEVGGTILWLFHGPICR